MQEEEGVNEDDEGRRSIFKLSCLISGQLKMLGELCEYF